MKRTKAFLLGAGLGTRLRPLTNQVTKCLVPIAGRPLLDYWIEQLVQVQVTEALLNTHHLAKQVREYIKQINAQGQLQLIESYEPQLLGSAGTLAANPYFADQADEVIVIYTDNFSTVNLKAMLSFHRQHDDPVTMMLFHAPNPKACGIAQLDIENRVVGFEEKPKNPVSDLANAGVYIFDTQAYQEIAAMNAFDLGFDVLPKFIGQMRGWVWEGYHRDIGTYETYLQAQRDAVDLLKAAGQFKNKKPAVFLDRDGTLIEQVHYLSKPEQVKLVPGAGEAIKRLRDAGFACILITNQSAFGRGLITEDDLKTIHEVLAKQLAQYHTQLDGIYYCPAVPQVKDRTVVEHYDRKPGPGMLFKAVQELNIDLTHSWMVGDMISDLVAGYHAHCHGLIFVKTGKGLEETETNLTIQWHEVADLAVAANLILDKATALSSKKKLTPFLIKSQA
jgi:D,D-heptose 1,7-bisphosphate phosphatase